MSRIKEQMQRQQEQQMLYMGKFLDYIYDNVAKPRFSNDELDEMETEHLSSSNHSTVAIGTISNKSLNAVNNANYYPRKGVNHGK